MKGLIMDDDREKLRNLSFGVDKLDSTLKEMLSIVKGMKEDTDSVLKSHGGEIESLKERVSYLEEKILSIEKLIGAS